MAINTNAEGVQIAQRNYKNAGAEQENEQLLQFMKGMQALSQQAMAGQQNKDLQAQKLKDLLTGHKETLNQDIAANKEVRAGAPEGSMIKTGDITTGIDPAIANRRKDIQGEEGAIRNASGIYQKGSAPLQKAASAAAEGLDLTNDTKQTGSLGMARTKLLSAFGMNRYNSDEAKAVIPPSLQGTVASFMNMAGDENSPMNEAQKRSANSAFLSILNNTKDAHDSLIKNAVGAYNLSNYANPAKAGAISQSLGQGTGDLISSTLKQYTALPTTMTPPDQRPVPTGIVDRGVSALKGLFSSQPAPSANAAPAAGPHGPAVVQNGVTYKWNPSTSQYE